MPSVFLDTNVLIYAAIGQLTDAPKWEKAMEIVMEADFAISAQVMAEFVSVVGRRSAPPMDEDKIDGWLVRLAYRLPIPIDAELLRRGRAISAEHGINYYDGAILAAAARLGCDTVLSEDMTDGRSYDSVTVRNPFRGS